MIRELRKADAPRMIELLRIGFPETEELLGTDFAEATRVVRRIFRWDTQLVVRLARWFGRPLYRFFVVEEDHQVVATTLLSFPERAGFVSQVVVDPAYRRRGYAVALLERARVATQATGRRFLALDVLAQNTPARALYERLGYRPLRELTCVVYDPGPEAPGSAPSAVRPFRARDVPPLLEIARRTVPPAVQEVFPVREGSVRFSGSIDRILASETAAWVVDRGRGAEAYVSATWSAVTAAGNCSAPIIGEGLDAADAEALVRTAVDFCTARGSVRVIARVPTANVRAHAALLGGGFHDAHTEWTLYRPVA
jgi:ribosomal protein S18 acetylase RimI-like enzyme